MKCRGSFTEEVHIRHWEGDLDALGGCREMATHGLEELDQWEACCCLTTGEYGWVDSMPCGCWGQVMVDAQFGILEWQPDAPRRDDDGLDVRSQLVLDARRINIFPIGIREELGLDDGRSFHEVGVQGEQL